MESHDAADHPQEGVLYQCEGLDLFRQVRLITLYIIQHDFGEMREDEPVALRKTVALALREELARRQPLCKASSALFRLLSTEPLQNNVSYTNLMSETQGGS